MIMVRLPRQPGSYVEQCITMQFAELIQSARRLLDAFGQVVSASKPTSDPGDQPTRVFTAAVSSAMAFLASAKYMLVLGST